MASGNDSGGGQLAAFLLGAIAGAAFAYLSAPQTGRETRDKLRGFAQDASRRAERVPHAVQHAYGRAAEAAKTAFNEALEQATEGEGVS